MKTSTAVLLDSRYFDEGGSAEFFNIIGQKKIGFKQFRDQKDANYAYNTQKLLSKYNLAPRVMSKVIKLNFKPLVISYFGKKYREHNYKSNWGFITEKARLVNDEQMFKKLKDIQTLVDNIYRKTKLKFWDSHYHNLGYITRKSKRLLVCIDTGKESFDEMSNIWGLPKPGPICSICSNIAMDCFC